MPATKNKSADHEDADRLHIGARLPPEYKKKFAMISAVTGRKKQDLLQEAVDRLYAAYVEPANLTPARSNTP